MLMAKGAETTSIDRLLERRLDALREGLEAWLSTQLRSPAAPASTPAHDALEMILRHLRDIHHCQLRIEAVATATLYGVADSEATGQDMEAQLQTRFDEHMACVWPHFLAENEHGLNDLHCYLMLPGDWPVGKIALAFDRRRDAPPAIADALVPQRAEDTIYHALDALGWTPMPTGGDGDDPGVVARSVAAGPPADGPPPRAGEPVDDAPAAPARPSPDAGGPNPQPEPRPEEPSRPPGRGRGGKRSDARHAPAQRPSPLDVAPPADPPSMPRPPLSALAKAAMPRRETEPPAQLDLGLDPREDREDDRQDEPRDHRCDDQRDPGPASSVAEARRVPRTPPSAAPADRRADYWGGGPAFAPRMAGTAARRKGRP